MAVYQVVVRLAPEVVGDDHDVHRAGFVGHAEVVAAVFAPVAVIVAASIDLSIIFDIVGSDH